MGHGITNMRPNFKQTAVEMQLAAQQHSLHLSTIQTLTNLLDIIKADNSLEPLKVQVARALKEIISPLTNNPIATDEVIG